MGKKECLDNMFFHSKVKIFHATVTEFHDCLSKDRRVIHRVTTSSTTNDKERQRMVQQVTTSDNVRR